MELHNGPLEAYFPWKQPAGSTDASDVFVVQCTLGLPVAARSAEAYVHTDLVVPYSI